MLYSFHSAGFSWIYHHTKNAENLFQCKCQNVPEQCNGTCSAIKPGGVLLGETVRLCLGHGPQGLVEKFTKTKLRIGKPEK